MGYSTNLLLLVVLGAYSSIFTASYGFINVLGANSSSSSIPRNFLFGTTSSSYQFEGAYLTDGKGLSNWDIFSHKPGNIADGSNGDIAVDHYHMYLVRTNLLLLGEERKKKKLSVTFPQGSYLFLLKELDDLELMEYIGLNAYRFSISWARILPKGRFGTVNMAGIRHYDKLINALIGKGIQPFVSLTHYDIPQELEDRYGGWLSPQVQQDFAYYAHICFKYYGDRVKYWVTFNEPNVVAIRGYRSGIYPPARCSGSFGNCSSGDSEREPFIVSGHATKHCALKERKRISATMSCHRKLPQKCAPGQRLIGGQGGEMEVSTGFQEKQKASIGIVMNAVWYEPISNSSQDRLAALRAQSFYMNWFLDPIIFGKYPEEMKDILGSLLPDLSNDYLKKLKNGLLDFIGVNHYTSFYAKDCSQSTCEEGPGVSKTEGYYLRTALKNVCSGLALCLSSRNGEDGFGVMNRPDSRINDFLNDDKRVEYMKSYLDALFSVVRKGADVRGYFAWSLLDNFEWLCGYTIRFGLYHVDYATLERTPKSSAKWYKHFISNFTSCQILADDQPGHLGI
ncbi:Glycoside hydrolase, catalytic domain-containing protein [Cynara cardunculus var. scolymus]|uniref:Glycoside hydrolase, catalytic domain-containing protein n=1 Tax=Cynara cardunculus var. scolymus TaxID=59895 RepID=A0A118JXZ6_CYNCS|nr:Glycoside hydrolase, catalytic domain-containing protein [Cynara cardunculus var. scolymus]